MSSGTLEAKRYAQAVFEMAKERNEMDNWLQDLEKVSLLAQDTNFIEYMQNPRFSYEIKSRLLINELRGIDPLILNLLLLLTTKGKFGLITGIREEYENFLNEYKGIEKAEVTTAVPLEETEKNDLIHKLEALSGKKIILSLKVDPSIIGGTIIRMGGRLIDGSISNRLSALKGELAGSET